MKKEMKVGIGFATGRKQFKQVLKTYIYNWRESELTSSDKVSLNLFVAYDLNYHNTKPSDYTNINSELLELVDGICLIGNEKMQAEISGLIEQGIINERQAKLVFGRGYAGKRNIIQYMALKEGIDYLMFLDDDEYPLAVTNSETAVWGGQQGLRTHLTYIQHADMTNGHHCGYISPIPYLEYNDILQESDFQTFIQAISNDIVNWDTIKSVMANGGVTYADTRVLVNREVEEVEEVNHSKFISGSNLCINLTDPNRVNAFYNPPNARGEDTFLATCLHDRKVLRVPSYTFHDGFSMYKNLLDGVLPTKLDNIKADCEEVIQRFYKACIGWIRYKPLWLYITDRKKYEERIQEMREQLAATLPKICEYFGRNDFMKIAAELENYHHNVKKHYNNFIETQQAWENICNAFSSEVPQQLLKIETGA
ncbi:hypothetical protein BABA_13617 [Neobacillus bataviensis LMG 21833]|uniref:Uncharacterized protein n=1 Tax=Neobacillus bataviensis LMG 21833 TaxID=1117379 RepID=K6C714_9BACI|nr:hypothetical protein [Neobacillus bataviensis]EKN66930.1 hypothetical protein BABA_13617 [Neobacillus bataviensis LMG 21833]